MDNIRCDLVLINCSPHLGNLLDLLDDVDGDDGDHQLDGGHGGQHRHPDDLVSLKPVQNLILARALLHPPGGVLIVLPENIKFISSYLRQNMVISVFSFLND